MLEDLLDVSRVTHQKVRMRLELVNLTRLVRDAVEECRDLLTACDLALLLELPPGPVWTSGDPTRLSQVVGNLLRNAAKFTDPGGRVTVRLDIDAAGGRAAIRVADTGVGIAPEMLLHLFEPFTQADQSLDQSRDGFGLGLALVRRLVQLHGGEVRVESEGPGKGSRFTVLLPLTTEQAGEEPGASHLVRARTAKLRVLIIEDNRDAAETLRDLLELDGCAVEVAFNGPDGVAAAERFRPELVFCDLGLPGMNGFQVAERLRQIPQLRGTRLVAMSGYGQGRDQRRSEAAGFDLHLVKPVEFEEVRKLLEVRVSGA